MLTSLVVDFSIRGGRRSVSDRRVLGLVREQPGRGQVRLQDRAVPGELRGPVHRLEHLPAQAVLGQGAVAGGGRVGRPRGRDGHVVRGQVQRAQEGGEEERLVVA